MQAADRYTVAFDFQGGLQIRPPSRMLQVQFQKSGNAITPNVALYGRRADWRIQHVHEPDDP